MIIYEDWRLIVTKDIFDAYRLALKYYQFMTMEVEDIKKVKTDNQNA
jgi:hypothetical protein